MRPRASPEDEDTLVAMPRLRPTAGIWTELVRVCVAYDCLYPYTVGGAERWYRNLATTLVDAGHEVTYLTRQQWPRGEATRDSGSAGRRREPS